MRAQVMQGQRRRVLITADAVGGVWTYALDLAAGLAHAGMAPTLAILGPPPSADQSSEALAVAELDLVHLGAPMDWTASNLLELQAAAALVANLADERRADLVHLNTPAIAGAASFAQPVISVAHSCLATWWSTVREGPSPEDFLWRIKAHWRGLTHSDAVIAPSTAFAEDTARAYEVPRPFVVHNGRRPAPAPAPRQRRGVVTVGRLWDDGKDIATLDRAAASLSEPVLAIGSLEAPHGERRRLIHARSLGRLPSDAVRAQFANAKIFASSSVYEPFGLAVLEAAQAGCALVLSDIPTFRELWDGAAVFAPPGDDVAFAHAIEALLADPARCAQQAGAARVRAARYTVEAMTAGVLDVYAALKPGTFLAPGAAA